MADQGQAQGTSGWRRVMGRVEEALGWATADRETEAKGQLEQLDAATPEAPKPAPGDEEAVLEEAHLHVRADHGDLAPEAEPGPDRQPVRTDPPEGG